MQSHVYFSSFLFPNLATIQYSWRGKLRPALQPAVHATFSLVCVASLHSRGSSAKGRAASPIRTVAHTVVCSCGWVLVV